MSNAQITQFLNLIYIVSRLNGVFQNYTFWIINYYVVTTSKYQWYVCIYVEHTKPTQFVWACCLHHCNPFFLSLVPLVPCLLLPHPWKHLLGMESWAPCFLGHLISSFHHLGMSLIFLLHLTVNYISLH